MRDVGPGAKPRQQPRKRRLQHHEQARARRPRQRRQPAVQFGVDASAAHARRDGSTPPAAAGRPAARSAPAAPQRLLPERKLPRDRAVGFVLLAQHRLLPQRVVGVLHRQRRKLPPTSPRTRARYSTPQVPQQRTQRPAVAGDVMQHQQQHVLGCRSRAWLNRNRCARSGSSPRQIEAAARPLLASAAASSSSRDARRPRARPAPRTPQPPPAAAPPARSGNTVRRLSCRSTRSHSAPSSAARSSSPVSRTASGIT